MLCGIVMAFFVCVCVYDVSVVALCAEVQSLAGELLSKWMAVFREGQSGELQSCVFVCLNCRPVKIGYMHSC